jgi:hypothetical protein
VALTGHWLVALKTDGTLWQWKLTPDKSPALDLQAPPARLGIHQDWVALSSSVWYGVAALAADGSLWYWSDRSLEAGTWLRLPRQPKALGNVLAINQPSVK